MSGSREASLEARKTQVPGYNSFIAPFEEFQVALLFFMQEGEPELKYKVEAGDNEVAEGSKIAVRSTEEESIQKQTYPD